MSANAGRRRRRGRPTHKPLSAIPTAGMADIAFLLMIFFVVTMVQSLDRTRVDLPDSRTRAGAGPKAAIVVLARNEAGAPGL